ncbi:exodeoxyribonuclease V subunit gamma [Nocardioides marmorisolisilvae]|uniref:RecBCD enzyme subunit RecC n=1 Tax=Nocardioides marmorisolisilvae TaxID=1542737 RepID=A0A3N0DIJ5_9ACTN|nr:exodeoxyribonuclease V subunit gamma [Nocardioides marmorisolisilvae]RNL75500.1 exodeoxyribonuclease V subunit gamma [Nocardioides marmorisolisilvae]
MTLHLHHADSTDVLAGALAQVLAQPLADPFAQEVVVVPAKGVERWLAQRLSHRLGAGSGQDGVCAGVRFLSPRSLVALLTGTERTDPWDPDRLVWPLLEVIDASLDEDWCATLARHLGREETGVEAELREGRRYSVARRLAGLFTGYAAQRPALVTAWREGRDEDGIGHRLDDDLLWQPQLWRGLLDRVDAPPPDVRHAATLEKLHAGGDDLDLPGRLSLFGHTRLPETEIELLAALGDHRDVHLWLPQVSASLADDLTEAVAGGRVPRSADGTAHLVGHPLLASLGRDARELQRSLAGVGVTEAIVEPSHAPERSGLLGWLQHDLRANAVAPADLASARTHDHGDRSVQVHACHGPARQVDVLREVLVGLLADDPTLEPRDILVMCPDVETFAPLIEAGFGLGEVSEGSHPAHRLRVRLADRGLQSTNALLAVAGHLVDLVGGRATASQVLDLLADDAVRRRFGFDDDDLAQLTRWVADSEVRWGLTREHRTDFGLGALEQNTWRAGLDRVLVGVAMAEEQVLLGRTLPLDDVGSGSIDLAGRFAEAVDRVQRAVEDLQQARYAGAWVSALSAGVQSLTAVDRDDAWQVVQLERELASIGNGADGQPVQLRVADVRALLTQRLAGRPTRANFRTGTLTVCTMVPMRSVPHRVVCLLGLDDGVFPRTTTADGDDVLARDPLTGERDPRSEDRQLLLDAVLAATETLVITYSGASEHTGQPRPPAVPVGELLDALDRTSAAPVRDRVLITHPLQPFDPRNLVPGELGTPGPFSFDAAARAGALAARHPLPVPPFLGAPVPTEPEADVTLAELLDFYRNPARALLRRLDIATAYDADEIRDAIPIDLDSLETWSVGDRIVSSLLTGADPQACIDAELTRGSLPPGDLAPERLTEILRNAEEVLNSSAPVRVGDPRSLDVVVDLGGGRRLVGAVPGIYGDAVVRLTYSSLRAKPALGLWLDLLAAQAALPDEQLTGHAFGKGSARKRGQASMGPVSAEFARDHLRRLVEIRDRGLTELAPLPLATGRAWAVGREQSLNKASWQAKDAWAASDSSPVPGENEDVAFVRLLGTRAPVEALVGLESIATAVWGPLLQYERGW